MLVLRSSAAVAAALLVSGCAALSPVSGPINKDSKIVVTTTGQETVIASHHRFTQDCAVIKPTITFVGIPLNGSVRTESFERVVAEGEAPGDKCVGQTIEGVNVLYTSLDGFKGEDTFTYQRLTGDRYDIERAITVEVE